MWDSLKLDARNHCPKIIADDSNAELNIVLAKVGGVPILQGRKLSWTVGLSTSMAGGMVWPLSEHYTHSEHQADFLDIRGLRIRLEVTVFNWSQTYI